MEAGGRIPPELPPRISSHVFVFGIIEHRPPGWSCGCSLSLCSVPFIAGWNASSIRKHAAPVRVKTVRLPVVLEEALVADDVVVLRGFVVAAC